MTERFLIFTMSGLALWMVHLAVDLPESYRAQNWDIAWVGFDSFMFCALAVTAWGMWKRRQIAVIGSLVTATLLLIDSWFDITTSQNGLDTRFAILTALGFQIPLAIGLARYALRIIHAQIVEIHSRIGVEILSVSLLKTPLGLIPRDIESREMQ